MSPEPASPGNESSCTLLISAIMPSSADTGDHLVLDSTIDGPRLFPFDPPSFGSSHGCPYPPTHEGLMRIITLTAISIFLLAASAHAAVITFGDQDCLGFGCYGATDPTSGAALQGLSPNAV